MYSSTDLKGPAESGCWKQLDYAEQRVPSLFPLEYRSYLGQAAHAVLQYAAERRCTTEAEYRKTGEEVGNLLIREGRTFRGHQEPPLPADDAWQGVDVAIAYLMARGLPVDAEALYPERDWEHPTIPAQALIDLVTVHEEGDEEYTQRALYKPDYKSSWQAGPDELNSLQSWMQTVIMWRLLQDADSEWPPGKGLFEIDIIRQSVINLRTWQEYTRDIDLNDPDDIAEMEKWERRIAELCETAEGTVNPGTGERQASPGVGCLSCAWRHVCEDAWSPVTTGTGVDPSITALDLARVEGQRSMLLAMLKAGDPEAPIIIPGGFVGYQEQVRRVLSPGKESSILEEWETLSALELTDEDRPALVSMLSALKLGKSNLDALAKALMPERRKGIGEERAALVEQWTDEKRFGQFGVWKDDEV